MSVVSSRSNTWYPRAYAFTFCVKATYLIPLPELMYSFSYFSGECVVSEVRYDVVPVHRSLTECSVVFAYKTHCSTSEQNGQGP